jgi:predicted Rossmann fold nucleotide-binding protein DprA/Smf involved in DNA uptake
MDNTSDFWEVKHNGQSLFGRGDRLLLSTSPTAFFSSRRCSGTAIRAAVEWALLNAKTKQAVIGGFHSPLEQSVLKVLLEARSPVVVVVSRSLLEARFDSSWLDAVANKRMLIVSMATKTERLTQESATNRNNLVSDLASNIVIAEAEPLGSLDQAAKHWRQAGKIINYLVP